jgi:hypothetical protein
MEQTNNVDEKLVFFLKNLANSIENGVLLPRQLQHIGEFFMSYQFQEQAIKDRDTSDFENSIFKKADLIKFTTMKFYH